MVTLPVGPRSTLTEISKKKTQNKTPTTQPKLNFFKLYIDTEENKNIPSQTGVLF